MKTEATPYPAPAPGSIKTAYDLKWEHQARCPGSLYFTRDSMRFFGDRMKNYGVRQPVPVRCGYGETVRIIDAFELYRRNPVKCQLQSSAWFCAATLERVHPSKA